MGPDQFGQSSVSASGSIPPPGMHTPTVASNVAATPADVPAQPGRLRRPLRPGVSVLLGGVVALWGLGILLSKIFGIGGQSVRNSDAYEFGQTMAVFFAAAMVVCGGRLAWQGHRRMNGAEVRPNTTRDRALVLGATMALFAFVLVVGRAVPDVDRHVGNAGTPYEYDYPAGWHPNAAYEMPSAPGLAYKTAVSSDRDGVFVAAFRGRRPDQVRSAMLRDLEGRGATVMSSRDIRVAGRDAARYDVSLPGGVAQGANIAVFDPNGLTYWIWCLWSPGSGDGKQGCEQVLETLQIHGPPAA